MRALDGTALAAAAASVTGAQYLVDLDFASGALRYTTNAVPITALGYTWLAYGDLVGVEGLREAEDGATGDVVLSLSVVSQALLAASIGSVEGYRGRRARIYLQMVGATFQPAGAAVAIWSGYMDRVRVRRATGDGPSSGSIEMVCTRSGANRARAGTGLRHTHQQQALRFAGDNGLQYVQTLIDTPAVWLTKAFQQR